MAAADLNPIIASIRQNHWRQGSALLDTAAKQLFVADGIPQYHDAAMRWLLLSHDCDIVHHNIDRETNVELMAAMFVNNTDGALTHGKNPRRLQMRAAKPLNQIIEFDANLRQFISRKKLAEWYPDPDFALTDQGRHDLAHWVALRYVRSALPDAFNDRLKPECDNIIKALKSHGQHITAIFVHTEIEELPAEQSYGVILLFTMLADDFLLNNNRISSMKALSSIEQLISKCEGIEIKSIKLASEADVSLNDRRTYQRMEFEHISGQTGGASPAPRP